MTAYEEHALHEFKRANWLNEDGTYCDEMQEAICKHVLELLEAFSNAGHSGSSAPYTINLFRDLALFKPITAPEPIGLDEAVQKILQVNIQSDNDLILEQCICLDDIDTLEAILQAYGESLKSQWEDDYSLEEFLKSPIGTRVLLINRKTKHEAIVINTGEGKGKIALRIDGFDFDDVIVYLIPAPPVSLAKAVYDGA